MYSASSKIDRINELKNGKGIQHLLDAAHEIFGNPLLMHDLEYKLLAYTGGNDVDDPFWIELISTGTHSDESIEFFKNECFIETVANAQSVTFLNSDQLKHHRIFGKILNRSGVMVACADVLDNDKPFEEDDPAAFEAFCEKLSKEVSRSEFYQNYGDLYLETIIKDLIDGNVHDKGLYSAHVANLYRDLKENLYLGVADISRRDPGLTALMHYRNLCKKTNCAFTYTIYSNYIVMIMSTDEMTLNKEGGLRKIGKLFQRNNIYAGISSRFDNLFELGRYYAEAVGALNDGLARGSKEWIFFHDEIGKE